MSTRAARWLLWLALVLMAPVPVMTGVVTAVVPAARILMLAGVCLLVVVLESANGVVGLFGLLLVVQAIAYLVLFFGVAHVASRLLGRLSPRAVAAGALVLVVTGIALTAAFDVYQTPFRAASARGSLFEIFE